jgi:hypothetical protein
MRLASLRDAFDVLRESVQAVRLGRISPAQAWAVAMLLDRWCKMREALRHQDRTHDFYVRKFGKRPAVNHPEHATYEDFPPPSPVITQQSAVNEAAALNPPDLYDPETGRRLAAPGIPLVPTIEELAFAAGPRAAELYPGVTPRPFVPTGHPMPYESVQLLRQAQAEHRAYLARESAASSTGYQPVPPAPIPASPATSLQPVPPAPSRTTGLQPVQPSIIPAAASQPAPGISSSVQSAQSADSQSSSPPPPKMPPRKQTDSARSNGHTDPTRTQAEAMLRGLKAVLRVAKSASAGASAANHGSSAKSTGANGRPDGNSSAKSSRSP